MSKLYAIDEATLKQIADAIRTKTGDKNPILVSDMPITIENIKQGGDVGDIEGTVVFENGKIDLIHTQKMNTFITERVKRIKISTPLISIVGITDRVSVEV